MPSNHTTPARRDTLAGACPVLRWALLAPLTTYAAAIPPFEPLALSAAVAAGGILVVDGAALASRVLWGPCAL